MKTGCNHCDRTRAYLYGRLAGFAGAAKTPPTEYDEDRRRAWLDGYDREKRRKVAASDRPQS